MASFDGNNKDDVLQMLHGELRKLQESEKRVDFAKIERSRPSEELLGKQIENSTKAFKNHEKALKHLNKGIAGFVPAFAIFSKKIKSTSTELERSIDKQSNAHQNAARAMYTYTKNVGVNSEQFKKTQQRLTTIEEEYKRVEKSVRERKRYEKQLVDAEAKHAKKAMDAGKQTTEVVRSLNADIDKLRKRIERAEAADSKKAVDPSREAEHFENLEKLELLEDIRDDLKKQDPDAFTGSIDKLREEISEAIEHAEDDGVKSQLENLRNKLEDGNVDISKRLGSVRDGLNGLKTGAVTQHNDRLNQALRLHKKRLEAQEKFAKAISAAVGDTFRKEMSMIQQRQMREGRQFGMRLTSAMMGMSEAEGLQVIDEQRYLLRRMATQQDDVTGAGELFRSQLFRTEMQRLGHLLGLTGKEAAEAILGMSDAMRRYGVDATEAQLDLTSRFLKESHKRFGITQDQMLNLFKDMSKDVSLALFGGTDNVLGSTEAINDEIELRMRLARVLNQEMDIQRQRVEELNRLRFGDPAEALRRGIMTGILGQQVGAFTGDADNQQRQQDLVRRYLIGDVAGHEREEGAFLLERLRLLAGERMAEGEMGERFPLYHIASRAGIDLQESAALRQRLGERGVPETVEEMRELSSVFAETQDPITELNSQVALLIRAIEGLRGTMQSSIGTMVGAIGGFVSNLIATALAMRMMGIGGRFRGAGMARLSRQRMGAGIRRAAPMARVAGPLAAVAGTGLAAHQIHQASQARTAGEISDEEFKNLRREEVAGTTGALAGMWAGGKAGAAGGALLGGWGAIPGAIIGGAAGAAVGAGGGRMIAGIGQEDSPEDYTEVRRRLHMDEGYTKGGERLSELKRQRQELQAKIWRTSDADTRNELRQQISDTDAAIEEEEAGRREKKQAVMGDLSGEQRAAQQIRKNLQIIEGGGMRRYRAASYLPEYFRQLDSPELLAKHLGADEMDAILTKLDTGVIDDEIEGVNVAELLQEAIQHLRGIDNNSEDAAKNTEVIKTVEEGKALAARTQAQIETQLSNMMTAHKNMNYEIPDLSISE